MQNSLTVYVVYYSSLSWFDLQNNVSKNLISKNWPWF